MMCLICAEREAFRGSFCGPCNKSYDRDLAANGSDILGAIRWAAKRARLFERKRARKEKR